MIGRLRLTITAATLATRPLLDPIEKAIRTALEKGDADDPGFRDRVYRAVEAALDRAIQANPQLTVEKAILRRRGLQEKIALIESEFAPAQAEADFDASLDAALLDILERQPAARPAEPAPAMPDWPQTERQSATTPASAPAVELRQAVQDAPPVATPAPAEFRAEAPPAARRPGERSEPTFSSPAPAGPPPLSPSPSVTPPRVEPTNEAFDDPALRDRQPVPEPSIDMGVVPSPTGRPESDSDFQVMPPALDTADVFAPVPESPPEIVAADRAARSREKRRPFAALFFGIAILSLAAVGFMFAFQTGLLKSPEERDTSVHNPPAQLESEDFDPGAGGPPTLSDQPAAQQNWITVFTPSNPATASAPGDAKAETMQDDSGAFLRIKSGASGSAISFDVGQGVLEQLAGKKAVFNMAARAAEGQETEVSIECNFGELGDCGRKRYVVGYERAEYLFEITFPNKRPGSSGTIAINSDFSGDGKALDIYEIRAAAQ